MPPPGARSQEAVLETPWPGPRPASSSRARGELPRGLFLPLVRRLQAGEGALLWANLAAIWLRDPGTGPALLRSGASLLALAAVYAANDFWDARADLLNPRKDRGLAALFLDRAASFRAALAGQAAAVLLLAHAAGTAPAALLLLALNALYSLRLKGTPVLDVVCAGAWGWSYAGLAAPPGRYALAVGLLTAACHVFQTLLDADADRANGVQTSAVRSPRLALASLAAACGLLAALLLPGRGGVWALSALLPLAAGLTVPDRLAAWALTKAYAAVLLISLLEPASAAF